ncbi:hypothetical protein [Aquimarina longa]|uniref:hypothetical protein n=1 Tax=Aquimarina longa TaxID=1080221 RepID=UPI000782BADC|nr:hypothetical protein [Aquimarina longa]
MTGEYLRNKIIMSGYQQVEVAERLGISAQHLESKLKAKDIKVSFLLDVARVINKNIYYFLPDLEKKNNNNKNQKSTDSPISLKENKNINQKADEFILTQIADILSKQLTPKFDTSQKSLDVLTEAQSRILLNQGELLDRIEELITFFKKEKRIS